MTVEFRDQMFNTEGLSTPDIINRVINKRHAYIQVEEKIKSVLGNMKEYRKYGKEAIKSAVERAAEEVWKYTDSYIVTLNNGQVDKESVREFYGAVMAITEIKLLGGI